MQSDRFLPAFYSSKEQLIYALNCRTGVFEMFSFMQDAIHSGCFEIKTRLVDCTATVKTERHSSRKYSGKAKVISGIKSKCKGWDIQLYMRSSWDIETYMYNPEREPDDKVMIRFVYYIVYDQFDNVYMLTIREKGHTGNEVTLPEIAGLELCHVLNKDKVWYSVDNSAEFFMVRQDDDKYTKQRSGLVRIDKAKQTLTISHGLMHNLYKTAVPLGYNENAILISGTPQEYIDYIRNGNTQADIQFVLFMTNCALACMKDVRLKKWVSRILVLATT